MTRIIKSRRFRLASLLAVLGVSGIALALVISAALAQEGGDPPPPCEGEECLETGCDGCLDICSTKVCPAFTRCDCTAGGCSQKPEQTCPVPDLAE